MHPRYGSWCPWHRLACAGKQESFDILEVGGKAEKPWIWREQICICPTFNLNLAKQVYMALLCCYTTETSRTLLKSLTFRKPSLPNGWKGDEQINARSVIGVTISRQFCTHRRQTFQKPSLGKWPAGRRTDGSVISVILARQYCGHWGQTCI